MAQSSNDQNDPQQNQTELGEDEEVQIDPAIVHHNKRLIKRKKFTETQKKMSKALLDRGYSYTEVSNKVKAPRATIYYWHKKMQKEKPVGLTREEINAANRDIVSDDSDDEMHMLLNDDDDDFMLDGNGGQGLVMVLINGQIQAQLGHQVGHPVQVQLQQLPAEEEEEEDGDEDGGIPHDVAADENEVEDD